jgi:ABC-type multidrug transport system fused ATPase/permease subunit
LEQGQIVEAGTPQELLSRPGPFQRYHALQEVEPMGSIAT